MGTPTIDGIAAPEENAERDLDNAVDTAPEVDLASLYTPELIEQSFEDFNQAAPDNGVTQGEFTQIITAIALPLMIGDRAGFDNTIEDIAERLNDDMLFQMSGVIPEPMQSRLRALVDGGSFSGTAIGSAGQQGDQARRDKEKRADAFLAATLAAQVNNIIHGTINEFGQKFGALKENLFNGTITSAEFLSQLDQDTAEAVQEAINDLRDEGLSDEEIRKILKEEILPELLEKAQDEELDEHTPGLQDDVNDTIKNALNRASEYSIEFGNSSNAYQQKQLSIGMQLAGFTLGAITGSFDTNSAPSIDEITAQMDAYYNEQMTSLNSVIEGQAEIEKQIEAVQQQMNFEAISGSFDQASETFTNYQKLLEQQEELTQQAEIASLQKEVVQLSYDYQKEVMAQINDDFSNLDINFLKNAIINAPDELMVKTKQLADMNGDSLNMFEQLIADAETAGLTPDQQAELNTFLQEVGALKTDLAEAQVNFEAAAEANAALYNDDGILMDGMNDFGAGAMSPVPSAQDTVDAAYNELKAAEDALAAKAAEEGVEIIPEEAIEEEVPAPAPTPYDIFANDEALQSDIANIVDELKAKGSFTQADLDAALVEYDLHELGGMTNYATEQITLQLEDAGITPTYTGAYNSAASQYDDPNSGPPLNGAPNLSTAFGDVAGTTYTDPAPAPDVKPDQEIEYAQNDPNSPLNNTMNA